MAKSQQPHLKKKSLVASLLFLIATSYLAWLIIRDPKALTATLASIDWLYTCMAIFIFIPMYFLQANYHAHILNALSEQGFDKLEPFPNRDTEAYLQSQVVRYLPGKIWGLLYQVKALEGRHSAGKVLSANLWQTVITTILSLGISIALLTSAKWPGLGVFCLFLTLIAIEWAHRTHKLNQFIKSIWHRWRRTGTPPIWCPIPIPLKATLLLLGEWFFYAAGMMLLASDFLPIAHAVSAMAWYAISSTLALAAIMIPAGLAIREALFVSGQDLLHIKPDILIVLAAQARLCMFIAELLATIIITLIRRIRSNG